jgi:hypothetical protein
MKSSERETYNLSFTGASLRPELARVVAETYVALGDWDLVKDRVLSTNALQSRSRGGAERLEREMRRRLRNLTMEQITMLADATADDRAALTWLAFVKHVAFAFEFAAEVLRDKLALHDPILRHSDYETYVEMKTVYHAELTELSSTSRYKTRQVLVHILAEAGLLRAGDGLGLIERPVLSPSVRSAIVIDDPRWLAGFLVPDAEIASL